MRAVIVDDEELSVKRLKQILSEYGEIEVCDTFLNPLEAYEFVKEHPVQLAFLDISMPKINGMGLASLLLELDASIHIVFVTGHDNYAVQAFDISALDYIMKPVSAQRISKTLDRLRNKPSSPTVVHSMESLQKGQASLTEQETRIVRLISDGLTNKDIAHRLNITAETVKSHVKNLYRKLKVKNRVQALQQTKHLEIPGE